MLPVRTQLEHVCTRAASARWLARMSPDGLGVRPGEDRSHARDRLGNLWNGRDRPPERVLDPTARSRLARGRTPPAPVRAWHSSVCIWAGACRSPRPDPDSYPAVILPPDGDRCQQRRTELGPAPAFAPLEASAMTWGRGRLRAACRADRRRRRRTTRRRPPEASYPREAGRCAASARCSPGSISRSPSCCSGGARSKRATP
jgi:hypothetical protein